ncbi:MAG: iron-sulfur cluster assembly accessory protein [Gammaproteobacteria bacterium]|nr:MAG: iron-sulfur cluster assembly accessory protein [Gammaproteobacteria bacterium]
MTASVNQLSEQDLSLTASAQEKMQELAGQVEENIEGVRVFASPGGCSGVNFGMTFTDQLTDEDNVREYEGFKLIVDSGTLQYLKGVEIDFVADDGQDARFVFNNLQPMGGGCGTCGSNTGGGCG